MFSEVNTIKNGEYIIYLSNKEGETHIVRSVPMCYLGSQ